MRPHQSSRTAEYMALFRALETARRPRSERLFVDEQARRFLRPSLRLLVGAAGWAPAHAALTALLDRRWPGARATGVARTRLIDLEVRRAAEMGITQVLILGSGYDTRAFRLQELAGRRVIEIDHPATLAAKLAGLDVQAGPLMVAADLAVAPLAEVLASALPRGSRALVIWEGVTNYLTGEAVARSLRALGQHLGPGSRAAVTYVHRSALQENEPDAGLAALKRTLAAAGEPWTFGATPDEFEQLARGCGWAVESDRGGRELRRDAGLQGERPGYEFYRLALLTRPGGEAGGGGAQG